MSLSIVLFTNKGERIGDVLNATERRLVLPHMRMPTFSWTTRIDHIRVPRLLSEPCIVQVRRTDPRYNSTQIVYNGYVTSAEENGAGDAQTVAFSSVGPLWMLTRRVIVASMGGAGYVFPNVIDGSGIGAHPAQIAKDVLAQANIGNGGATYPSGWYHTGVREGNDDTLSLAQNSPRRLIYGPVQQKTAGDALNELSAGASSFEWAIRPIKLESGPDFGGGLVSPYPYIARLDVADVIGTKRSNAIFQFGGGGKTNVESYTRTVARDTIANNVYMPTIFDPGKATEQAGAIQKFDRTSMDANNQFDDIVSDNGISSTTLKTNLAQEHVNVRKNPRETITFKPSMNAWPSPISDYDVGDTVRCRAVVGDSVRFDRWMRVWGITINFDANDNESVELELTTP